MSIIFSWQYIYLVFGRMIANTKENKMYLTNHETGEQFEFTLKNKKSTSDKSKSN